MSKRAVAEVKPEKESSDREWLEWKRELVLRQVIMNERSGYVLQKNGQYSTRTGANTPKTRKK